MDPKASSAERQVCGTRAHGLRTAPAVILAAFLPTGALAQNYAASHLNGSVAAAPAVGMISLVPAALGAVAPLSLSAPSIAPTLPIIPVLTAALPYGSAAATPENASKIESAGGRVALSELRDLSKGLEINRI